MIEKVNPSHPDKIADRIAGAMVDLAYKKDPRPRVAVEVLIGHHHCFIIAETSVHFELKEVFKIVNRISGANCDVEYHEVPQDPHLADNQSGVIKCGDNGIFRGLPVSDEEKKLSKFAHKLYKKYPTDGKFIIKAKQDGQPGYDFIVCQSGGNNKLEKTIEKLIEPEDSILALNPLGDWTGGIDVDSGATNRKLGSDMGKAVTGGGLHGKDLSKADVAINIYVYLKAQVSKSEVNLCCAIGDEEVGGIPYAAVVATARKFINDLGGFEKLAEWGLF